MNPWGIPSNHIQILELRLRKSGVAFSTNPEEALGSTQVRRKQSSSLTRRRQQNQPADSFSSVFHAVVPLPFFELFCRIWL
jgi:hypothetical protein